MQFLADTKNFLLNLTDSAGKRLAVTKRRMFVIGLCISIDSVMHLTQQLLLSNGTQWRETAVHANVQIFSGSHRDTVCHHQTERRLVKWSNGTAVPGIVPRCTHHIGVVPTENSNCRMYPVDDILYDDSEIDSNVGMENSVFADSAVVVTDHSYSALLPTLSQYVENVISYIASFVVRRLLPKLKCSECRHLLVDAENVSAPTCSFLKLKNNGRLVVPSAGIVRVVQLTEQFSEDWLVLTNQCMQDWVKSCKWLCYVMWITITFFPLLITVLTFCRE